MTKMKLIILCERKCYNFVIHKLHMTFNPEGNSYPIGPTLTREGVNFCLFSKNCENVELLLFNKSSDVSPTNVIPFDRRRNHSGNYWHIFVPGLKAGQLYGYRVAGEVNGYLLAARAAECGTAILAWRSERKRQRHAAHRDRSGYVSTYRRCLWPCRAVLLR